MNYRSDQFSKNMSDEQQWLIHNTFLEDFSFWKNELIAAVDVSESKKKNAYADYCDYVIRDGRMPIEYALFIVRITE